MNIITKWILMKPMLKRLVNMADEELVHQHSYIIILFGAFVICLVFLFVWR